MCLALPSSHVGIVEEKQALMKLQVSCTLGRALPGLRHGSRRA